MTLSSEGFLIFLSILCYVLGVTGVLELPYIIEALSLATSS